MADLFHRVSIRKYQDRPVEREKIVEILRAAMAAPSAKNQQPWEFYVITKKDTLEKLSKASPYAGMTANAPVAIISAYRKDCDVPCYADIDMSIAMENLWLKTDEIGLGGVWLGIAPIEERMKEVEEIVGIPEDQRAKIIMTTALNEGANVNKAFDLGCVAYAGKPIDQVKFESVLRKLELID